MSVQKDDDEFKNVINNTLVRHNFYRKKHNVPSLKISSKVCKNNDINIISIISYLIL